MSNFSGFAAVAEVREGTLNTALRIYHGSGLVPVSLGGTRVFANPVGPGAAVVTFGLFLDAPRLTLSAALNNRVAVSVRLVGSVQANAAGIGSVSRQLMMTSTILVGLTLSVGGPAGVNVRIPPEDVEITALDVVAVDGMAIPTILATFIQSAGTREALTQLLRTALAAIPTIAPPMLSPTIPTFGIGKMVSLAALRYRVLDQALAVAIDVAPGTISVQTQGDWWGIGDFLGKSHLAVCVNPVMLKTLRAMALPVIQEKVSPQGVSVDDLWIKAESHNLFIGGHATKGVFGASFSMRAKPKLGTPETVEKWESEYGTQYWDVHPGSDDIWADVYDVDVDTEIPWYVYLGIAAGTILLIPAAPVILLIIAATVDSVRQNAMYQIESGAETGAGSSRVQRMTLPGTTGPFVDLTVSTLDFGTSGLLSRLWFTPKIGDSALIEGPFVLQDPSEIKGPAWIDAGAMAEGPLHFSLIHDPLRWHLQDPLIRVRWQVRRLDTNQVVVTKETTGVSPGALDLWLDMTEGTIGQSDEFSISCRVYRALGGPIEELVNRTVKLHVTDTLDRHHPYVKWSHGVFIPQLKVHDDGSKEITGYRSVVRRSAIHRTAVPGRCRFAKSYPFNGKASSTSDYLDELPFPLSQLNAHRDELCDYCFYGGPDKTIPLIPTE